MNASGTLQLLRVRVAQRHPLFRQELQVGSNPILLDLAECLEPRVEFRMKVNSDGQRNITSALCMCKLA